MNYLNDNNKKIFFLKTMNVNTSNIKHAFYNVHIYSIYFVLKKEMNYYEILFIIFFHQDTKGQKEGLPRLFHATK